MKNHEGTVSIDGRTIINLRFTDDIDGIAGEEDEQSNFVQHLEKVASAYSIGINATKTKLMMNITQDIFSVSCTLDPPSLKKAQN